MKQANATYSIKNWKRKPWDLEAEVDVDEIKFGRVEMIHTYEGDIEGEGVMHYIFGYNEENEGGFVGLETVIGTIEGRSGSFIVQCSGTTKDGRLKQTLTIVPGSGTGELQNLTGQATMETDLHMEQYPLVLEYQL